MFMHHCVHVGMIKDPASRSVMVVAITTNVLLLLGIFHTCSLLWLEEILESPDHGDMAIVNKKACIGELQVTWWHC